MIKINTKDRLKSFILILFIRTHNVSGTIPILKGKVKLNLIFIVKLRFHNNKKHL